MAPFVYSCTYCYENTSQCLELHGIVSTLMQVMHVSWVVFVAVDALEEEQPLIVSGLRIILNEQNFKVRCIAYLYGIHIKRNLL